MAGTPKARDASGTLSNLSGPLEPGVILQRRYKIDRLLGGGGMGMVYLAHDQRLSNRPCAIKEMVDHFIDPQQRIEANDYFAREADTLAQLKHPAIPAISDRFDDQNRHYLVMEYVEGRNLEEELAARGGPLPEGLVIDIACQLCDVLAYLHGLQPSLIYRDMKPSNVMLTGAGRAVLVDFGIARLFKAQRKGTMIGTLGFAPPEQYQGIADPRSDIYSLGATLHYVLTGRDPEKFPPFSFPPVRDLRPEVSRNLAGAIDHALAYEMSGRPSNIAEFRDMLLYGRGLGTGVPPVSSKSGTADLTLPSTAYTSGRIYAPPHPRQSGRKRRVGALLVLPLMLAGLAFGATYVYQDPQLQARLGVQPLINSLPWKHRQLVAEARQHPLKFDQMTLALSTRSGSPLSPPKSSFTDSELTNNPYLKWDASFTNELAGLGENQDGRIEARFYDAAGVQIASSSNQRFIGSQQTAVDFSGVALITNNGTVKPGDYRIALYSDDKLLGEQRFTVTEDLAAKTAALRAKAEADAAAKAAATAEETKREEDARRLAMVQERMRRPLQLQSIEFINSTKDGTALSKASTVFNVSKVLFIGWRTVFENRLYGLDANQYRVDAAYVAPDGSTLGSVNDIQTVQRNQQRAVFSGRVGNSAGGAFLPGQYTVNFYLNGQYFAQRKFRVIADAALPSGGYSGSSTGYGGTSLGGTGISSAFDVPTLATGTVQGIGGHGSAGMELRLRPQPNGFLDGEMVVELAGYGVTLLRGFVRGNNLQFSVAYGANTFDFEGTRHGDTMNGTFEGTSSGEHGTWSAHAN
jgi:serine/threonine protein kinase